MKMDLEFVGLPELNDGVRGLTVQTLIVGTGAAGLNAAVSLYRQGVTNIALLTEGRQMGTSRNTGSDKQTYYKMTTCGSEGDSVGKMAQTLFAGGCMDGDLAMAEAAGSLRSFYHLVQIGVPFPFDELGEYVGYKTDHDPLQRGTSAGPLTSKFMTEALFQEVEACGIPVLDGYQAVELLTEKDRVCGLVALNRNPADIPWLVISAENIVYATGGEAGMYEQSVYPVSQTGGMGLALRAGAKGKNLTESQYGIASLKFRWNLSGTYQQVLPAYISTDADGGDEREFLQEYFPDGESLLTAIFRKGYQWPFDPRKIADYGSSLVDLLVYQETVLKGRRVWLDFRKNPTVENSSAEQMNFAVLGEEAGEYLRKSGADQATPILRLAHMNPGAIELYADHGIDLYHEPLEIAVCAQHNNGGLAGNAWWESNLRHLFPVGEVNGTHGVYRPGGTALNSGQVGSLRAAQYIAGRYTDAPKPVGQLAVEQRDKILQVRARGEQAAEHTGPLYNWKKQLQKLGSRMSAAGACIRSLEEVQVALRETKEQQVELQTLRVDIHDRVQLGWYYRTEDLLVSQQTYLEAILDYMQQGGKSRGSYLIWDANGEKPLAELPERFRYSLDGEDHTAVIQEMQWTPEGCVSNWRPVRPIPTPDTWFENVWRAYRDGDIYQKTE